MKTELFPSKFYLPLEYTISKALSNYVELDFKDEGQSGFTGDTARGKSVSSDHDLKRLPRSSISIYKGGGIFTPSSTR